MDDVPLRKQQAIQEDKFSSSADMVSSTNTSLSEPISDTSSDEGDVDKTRTLKNSVDEASGLWPWMLALVWPLMLTLPLLLTCPYSFTSYQQVFPAHWYEYDDSQSAWPKPLGLILGILAVAIGQVWVCLFFYLFKYGYFSQARSVQAKGACEYYFWEGIQTHFSQPEGFGLLVSYLSLTWMLGLMPTHYYSFQGGIQYKETFLCLVVQDAIQYIMHLLEHVVSPTFYQASHKPHHRFINPRLFDAFNGSLADTVCMIIIPLYTTANLVRHVNVWTYMAFGSTYACWLTLIHSEYVLPWDGVFRRVGFGTAADHHVHHKFFKYNYGHLFMWWDWLGGTYRDPRQFAPRVFRANV